MADGVGRSVPPEGSSSSRARQRFSSPNYPDAGRRNTTKYINAVPFVLRMFAASYVLVRELVRRSLGAVYHLAQDL